MYLEEEEEEEEEEGEKLKFVLLKTSSIQESFLNTYLYKGTLNSKVHRNQMDF